MRMVKWKSLVCVCALLPAAGIADDAVDRLYESRWALTHVTDSATYIDEWPQSSATFDIDVDDGSSIMRVTKIRSLSLLTLAGDEQSKWFLGINEDGIVGVHFRGFTRNGAKRHLDVAALFASDDDEQEDEDH